MMSTRKLNSMFILYCANEFAKIRTGERLRVGRCGDPVAEYSRFRWTIMSPGEDQDLTPFYFVVNSNSDFEGLMFLA